MGSPSNRMIALKRAAQREHATARPILADDDVSAHVNGADAAEVREGELEIIQGEAATD